MNTRKAILILKGGSRYAKVSLIKAEKYLLKLERLNNLRKRDLMNEKAKENRENQR